MRTYGSAVAITSLAALGAGVVWPHLAERFLQMLLVALAISHVGARAYRAGLPERLVTDTFSPFDAGGADRPPVRHGPTVQKLADDLRGADDTESARSYMIPPSARRIVRSAAVRRLSERHALQVEDPSHHARIRQLVSAPTWSLIRRDTTSARGLLTSEGVPLMYLDTILEDLERL